MAEIKYGLPITKKAIVTNTEGTHTSHDRAYLTDEDGNKLILQQYAHGLKNGDTVYVTYGYGPQDVCDKQTDVCE